MKISTTFAVVVIIVIGGLLAWIFLIGNNSAFQEKTESRVAATVEKEQQCAKHAYDGEVKVKVWNYGSEKDESFINIAEEDLAKLPANCKNQKAKIVDVSSDLDEKIKKSSKENPVEVTIKGVLNDCGDFISLSLESGEKVFKKYLNQG